MNHSVWCRGNWLLGAVVLAGLVAVSTVSVVLAGPLLEKAKAFDEQVQTKNCPNGLVFDMHLNASGTPTTIAGGGDSSIWTGAYIASQVFRYLATKDPAALKNVERGLAALHILQAVTGSPGFAGRSFAEPALYGHLGDKHQGVGSYSHLFFNNDTSRDQYTGLFLAYSLSWPLIQDAALRETVKEDVRAMGQNLVRHKMALVSNVDGKSKTQFNLNPWYCYQDRITPHEWEVVDDYPICVLTKIIPFNATTAAAIATLMPPPIRGGEALRGLLMMKTAASITQDPELVRFFQEELCQKSKFVQVASDTSQLFEEIFEGKGRDRVIPLIADIEVALTRMFGEILAAHEILPRPILKLMGFPTLLFTRLKGEIHAKILLKVMAWLNQPNAFLFFKEKAPQLENLAATLESWGVKKLAARVKKIAARCREIGDSSMDQVRDALRSYVGTNLTFFALLGIMAADPAPELKAAGTSIVDRAFGPIADEGNSMYTYIRAAYGSSPLSKEVMDAARQTLLDYPADQRGRPIDHSKDPGIRVLPWPDRFGRYDRMSVNCFPMNERSPHIFIWQESPRDLRRGGDPNVLVAPVGYLMAYWFGRCQGFLTEAD